MFAVRIPRNPRKGKAKNSFFCKKELRLDFGRKIRYNNTVLHTPVCRNGRRGGLKIPCANNTCGFDPHHRHKKEALQLVWGAFFLSAACERVEQHDPAQQGSNQPCGLLLSARETPTTGIASSSKSKGFGLLFFFYSVSYTLVFSGKILAMALAEETLLEKSRCV